MRKRDCPTAQQALCTEREHLRPFSAWPPERCRIEARTADKFGHVRIDRNAYSVPIAHAFVPFDRKGADLLFNFVTKVYERRSLVVTTNLAFARWSEVFLDATAAAAAVIDRIAHHASVLQAKGSSHRLKDAKAKRSARRRKGVAR